MATQLAALRGCRVTTVTSSDDRGNRLIQLCADQYVSREAARSAAQRYDVIIDTVGGTAMPAYLDKLADNGRYALCGGVAGAPPTDFGSVLISNFHRSPSFLAFSLNSVDQQTRRDAAHSLFGSAAEGGLRPVVSSRLALDDVIDGLSVLRNGDVFGKVVINP